MRLMSVLKHLTVNFIGFSNNIRRNNNWDKCTNVDDWDLGNFSLEWLLEPLSTPLYPKLDNPLWDRIKFWKVIVSRFQKQTCCHMNPFSASIFPCGKLHEYYEVSFKNQYNSQTIWINCGQISSIYLQGSFAFFWNTKICNRQQQ